MCFSVHVCDPSLGEEVTPDTRVLPNEKREAAHSEMTQTPQLLSELQMILC